MASYLITAMVAAGVAYFVTPLIIRMALKFGAIDVPDDRKVHSTPTPTMGGTAMFVAILCAMAVASALPLFSGTFRTSSEPYGIIVGAAIIYLLGVVDDLKGLGAPAKLAGQVFAAGLVFLSGVRMEFFRVPVFGGIVLSEDLSAILTIFWIVALINAINLIDGLDGLAAGLAAIAATIFFIYSYRLSVEGLLGPELTAPLVAIIVAGACLGFLRYNFHPARIFMGDSGSMLLGFFMAAATVIGVGRSRLDLPSEVFIFYFPVAAPLLLLAVPILDTTMAIVRRARKGTPVFLADKEHMHHRLLELGHGHRKAVLIMYLGSALLGGATLAAAFLPSRAWVALFVVGALLTMLYALFGRRPVPLRH